MAYLGIDSISRLSVACNGRVNALGVNMSGLVLACCIAGS